MIDEVDAVYGLAPESSKPAKSAKSSKSAKTSKSVKSDNSISQPSSKSSKSVKSTKGTGGTTGTNRIDGTASDFSSYLVLSDMPITTALGEKLDTKEVTKMKGILTSRDGINSNDLATLAVAIRDSMDRTGNDVDEDFGDDMMDGSLYGGILGAASTSLRQKLLSRDDPLFPLCYKQKSTVVPGRIK